MPYVAVLGCGPGGHVLVFPGLLLCFVTQNNDAGVLVGETGQRHQLKSNFHIWKQSWLGAAETKVADKCSWQQGNWSQDCGVCVWFLQIVIIKGAFPECYWWKPFLCQIKTQQLSSFGWWQGSVPPDSILWKWVHIQCWEQAGSILYYGMVELSPCSLCPGTFLVGRETADFWDFQGWNHVWEVMVSSFTLCHTELSLKDDGTWLLECLFWNLMKVLRKNLYRVPLFFFFFLTCKLQARAHCYPGLPLQCVPHDRDSWDLSLLAVILVFPMLI